MQWLESSHNQPYIHELLDVKRPIYSQLTPKVANISKKSDKNKTCFFSRFINFLVLEKEATLEMTPSYVFASWLPVNVIYLVGYNIFGFSCFLFFSGEDTNDIYFFERGGECGGERRDARERQDLTLKLFLHGPKSLHKSGTTFKNQEAVYQRYLPFASNNQES